MAAVREYGHPRVDDPARLRGVEALGVDETAFLRASARHATTYVTGIVDVRAARLLDVVLGRSGPVLSQWVHARPDAWRAGIEVAALDPFRGYATAPRVGLPQATRVLDAFHVTRLGFAAVDEVRRRVQQHSTGHQWIGVAAARTRCGGSGGCCAAAPSTCPTGPGTGCWPGWPPATSTSRSPNRGSPRRTCG